MSNSTIFPQAAVQFSAMASALARYVRNLLRATPASAANADLWQLYCMSRGTDSVSPAVASRLAAHARSK